MCGCIRTWVHPSHCRFGNAQPSVICRGVYSHDGRDGVDSIAKNNSAQNGTIQQEMGVFTLNMGLGYPSY